MRIMTPRTKVRQCAGAELSLAHVRFVSRLLCNSDEERVHVVRYWYCCRNCELATGIAIEVMPASSHGCHNSRGA